MKVRLWFVGTVVNLFMIALVGIFVVHHIHQEDVRQARCAVAIEAHRNLERNLAIQLHGEPWPVDGWPTATTSAALVDILNYEGSCYQ